MRREEKQQTVEELREKFEAAQAVFVTHYRGLTVAQMNELRRAMDKQGASYRVAKNTLVKRALEGLDAAVVSDELTGPTGFVFVNEDPAATAKTLCDFAKDNDKLEIKCGALGASMLSADDITALSKLPSRDQMLSMLLSVLEGPTRNLVGVLAAVPRSMVQVLGAIEEEKKKAA